MLIVNMLMKFIVFAPKFKKNTHTGVLALHDLSHSLCQLGHDSRVMEWENLTNYDSESIVIYPEVVIDNPLGASRVVRYFMHMDSYITGNKVQSSSNDFILAWTSLYYPNAHSLLSKYFINNEFNDINTKPVLDRSLDCTWFHKARYHQGYEVVPGTISIGANGALSKQGLADLLRQTRILYTYDILSNLVYEAIFCGVLVVPLSWKPFSPEQIKGYNELEFPYVTIQDNNIIIPMDYSQQRQDFINRVNLSTKNYLIKLESLVQQIGRHFNLL